MSSNAYVRSTRFINVSKCQYAAMSNRHLTVLFILASFCLIQIKLLSFPLKSNQQIKFFFRTHTLEIAMAQQSQNEGPPSIIRSIMRRMHSSMVKVEMGVRADSHSVAETNKCKGMGEKITVVL